MAAESSALPMNTGEGAEEDDDQVEIEEVVEESYEVKEKKEKDEQETEMEKIEEDKKNMSVVEKLDTAFYWKTEGNNFFSKGELARAADAYYHAIIYCRELTNNPKYYRTLVTRRSSRSWRGRSTSPPSRTWRWCSTSALCRWRRPTFGSRGFSRRRSSLEAKR